jgi:hypothetical protein
MPDSRGTNVGQSFVTMVRSHVMSPCTGHLLGPSSVQLCVEILFAGLFPKKYQLRECNLLRTNPPERQI